MLKKRFFQHGLEKSFNFLDSSIKNVAIFYFAGKKWKKPVFFALFENSESEKIFSK